MEDDIVNNKLRITQLRKVRNELFLMLMNRQVSIN